MAWNKPTSSTVDATSSSRPAGRGKMPRLRLIIAGAVVVALGVLCIWMFSSGKDTPQAKADKERGFIKEVAPSLPKPPTQAQKLKKRYPWLKIPDDWEKPYPPQAYWPDGRLKEHTRYVKVVTNGMNRLYLSKEQLIFPEGGPNVQIASLLAHEPGDLVIGEYDVGKNFNKFFLESLEKPIVINDSDDEYAKALKQAVIETKADLKRRLDAGENLRDVLNDTRKEMRELSLYRQEIQKMVADVKRDKKGELTAKDLEDLYGAANKMLADRGVKPLQMPGMIIRRMKIREAEAAAKAAAKTNVGN